MSSKEEDFETEYLTREQALEIARSQALRNLSESDTKISYVAFMADFEDYCYCEFTYEVPDGWVFSCQMLREEARQPEEQITDAHILRVVREGNLLSAIRLYRGKYGVGLTEGKAEVERLMSLAE
jgi:hypothetical protein